MARPIEYNKNEVLDRAMEVFWNQGFEPTSMKDLVDATKMTTRSMYNIFESKNGLFKATLEWYYEVTIKRRFEKLLKEDGTKAIRNYMDTIAHRKYERGCLFVNTATDRYSDNSEGYQYVEGYFTKLENVFVSKLIYANEVEGYNGDPNIRAKQLISIIQSNSGRNIDKDALKERNQIIDEFLMLMEIH